MELSEKPFNGCDDGSDFWNDTVLSHGINEAITTCGIYLDMQLKMELSDDMHTFCRDMFEAMYESTAEKIIPSRFYYPYDFKTANKRGETAYYHKNQSMNEECVRAIDEAINASNYKPNLHNLKLAAMYVIGVHGFSRVNAVLAHHIQKHESDGRYSRGVKRWALHFVIPENSCGFLNSHATLVDSFAIHVRKLNADSGAILPGRSEYDKPDSVHGYETIQSILFSEDEGLVIACNPIAPDEYACWEFTLNNGKRDYCRGVYGDKQSATDDYNARLFVKTIKL